MTTKEHIQDRISILEREQTILKNSHANMIQEHQNRTAMVQEAANKNAERLSQIAGALSELKTLLNGQHAENQGTKP